MLRYLLVMSIIIYLTYVNLADKSIRHNKYTKECSTIPDMELYPLSATSLSIPPPLQTRGSLPDIVLGPGGVAGFYSLGITHYLLNHFDLKDKKLVGFSAGSFIMIFMSLSQEKRNSLLQEIFKCKEKSASNAMRYIMDKVETVTSLDDYNFNGSSIAVSHPGGIEFYDHFLTIQQLTRCCKSSSFIPFVTHDSGMSFYNHTLSMDGGVYYGSFLKQYTERPLVITPSMFGRYPNTIIRKIRFVFGIHVLKTTSMYQMYLYGYHDARKNHSFFKKYLQPIHSSS